MLIFNDEQRLRAGIRSLSKRCPYCSKALAAYPLILWDDAGLFVYHAACAAALATEILVDLYTFFRPPEPYQRDYLITYFTSLGSPNWQTHLSTSPLFPTLNSGAHWLQQEF